MSKQCSCEKILNGYSTVLSRDRSCTISSNIRRIVSTRQKGWKEELLAIADEIDPYKKDGHR